MSNNKYLPVEAKPVTALQWLVRDHLAMIKVMTALDEHGIWSELHVVGDEVRLVLQDGEDSVGFMRNHDWVVFTDTDNLPLVYQNAEFRRLYNEVPS